MKTVWILNHYAIPPELGPLTRHYKFGKKLIERDYKVKIFASSALHYQDKNMITDRTKYREVEYGGVPFIYVKTSSYHGNGMKRILNMFQFMYGAIRIGSKMRNEKPDVVYASSAHPLTWIAGYILSKKYQSTFIAETRDLWPESLIKLGEIKRQSPPAKILFELEKFIYNKADKLVFTFPGGKDYAKEIGIDTDKITNINNGVDNKEFNLNVINNEFHHDNIDDKDSFKIVYTGSIGKPNAVHYLIDSAKLIQDRGFDNMKFLVFGDGKEKERLKDYCTENSINNILFYGRIDKIKIPSILSKSDLNIITGVKTDLYKYGLSLNKMFEYFAAGKPIISNVETKYDLLQEYSCGLTVNGASPEALADGIIQFYELTKSEYQIYCENALKAAEDFDFEKLTDKLEDIM